ncbi:MULTISPECIES: HipA family kinase [unclassified Thiocapsa]|uniref:HipA family kinase n=1 Tax=unclassified Thiocapsa TaxID=2641286 RepID=UPI0035B28B50
MTVQVVEVLRRSEQGMTRPFICRGDDGEIYFVKGVGAGRRSQICEWVAGKLASVFGLPIAPFRLLDVPEELIEADGGLTLSELGSGPAFGSQWHEAMELTVSAVLEIPDEIQQDVLAFDWWIQNGDRLLTERGGNPNLFWNPASRELVVIDHNQAFDLDFDPNNFFDFHVFAHQRHDISGDMLKRHDYNRRFASALGAWPVIRAGIPDAWLFADPEMTVPVDFDLDMAYQLLKRHERNDFWKTP